MKTVVIILFSWLISLVDAKAQIGRHELPMDTIPIGGEQQQVQEDKMAGQDDLLISLILLRDSVNTFIASPEGKQFARDDESGTSLASRQKTLESIITSLKNSESNVEMMKKGYAIQKEIRKVVKKVPGKNNPVKGLIKE